MNCRTQVDIINIQSQADRENKWIFAYQDHLTKRVQLRTVKFKHAPEMVYKQLDKFSIFGASGILQIDNREFAKSVIEELCSM